MSKQKECITPEIAYKQLERIGKKWPKSEKGNEALIKSLLFEAWPYVRVIGKLPDAEGAVNKWMIIPLYPEDVSVDETISSEEEDIKIVGTIPSDTPTPEQIMENQYFETKKRKRYAEVVSTMTALVLNYQMMVHRGGKKGAKDEKYIKQNRICFTEQFTCDVQKDISLDKLKKRDIAHALSLSYIRYFSENGSEIHTLSDLKSLRLKKNSLFLKNHSKETAEKPMVFDESGWLPNKVPSGFLNGIGLKTSDSQVSEMRDRFLNEVRTVLVAEHGYSRSDFSEFVKK